MKMSRMFMAAGLVLFLSLSIMCTKQEEKAEEKVMGGVSTQEMAPVNVDRAGHDPIADGKGLFTEVGLGTNGKSCASCHKDGTDLVGKAAQYPRVVEMLQREASIQDVVNLCIVQAMGGEELDVEGEKMKSLTVFLESL